MIFFSLSYLWLATMQCANKYNTIIRLKHIVHLAFQFPVTVIDEHENARAHMIALNKKLFPLLD